MARIRAWLVDVDLVVNLSVDGDGDDLDTSVPCPAPRFLRRVHRARITDASSRLANPPVAVAVAVNINDHDYLASLSERV
jgi:hypothetical protein